MNIQKNVEPSTKSHHTVNRNLRQHTRRQHSEQRKQDRQDLHVGVVGFVQPRGTKKLSESTEKRKDERREEKIGPSDERCQTASALLTSPLTYRAEDTHGGCAIFVDLRLDHILELTFCSVLTWKLVLLNLFFDIA